MSNNKYEIQGWYMYDWANSAFASVVVTTLLGPYLIQLIKSQGGQLTILGLSIGAESFFLYSASISVALQVIVLPFLGTIADYTPYKKRLLLLFAYIGAICTILLFFVTSQLVLLGGLLFIVANVSFGAAIVFYNAFLPDIVSPDGRDTVSSKGFAYGYVSGGTVLFLSILLLLVMEDDALAVRICMSFAGLWWLIFTFLFPQQRLVQRETVLHLPPGANLLTYGFKAFLVSLKEMAVKHPSTLKFLIAALIYNDGIQTINIVATTFGASELGLGPGILVQVVLMIQFVAAIGAILFNQVARRIGAKRTIIITLFIWCGIVIYAYFVLDTELEFWFLGFMVGMVLGSSQALSRSLFSQLVPKSREATYFGIYEISQHGTTWLGPLVSGLARDFTGSTRVAILPVIAFFAFGLIVLYFTNVRKGIQEAGNEVPAVI